MLGSIAEGVTEATGFLEGQDALYCECFPRDGRDHRWAGNGQIRIQGVSLGAEYRSRRSIWVILEPVFV